MYTYFQIAILVIAAVIAIPLSNFFSRKYDERNIKIGKFADELDLYFESLKKLNFFEFSNIVWNMSVNYFDDKSDVPPVFHNSLMIGVRNVNTGLMHDLFDAYQKSSAYKKWYTSNDANIAHAI